ncbi:sugar phosphate permease [Bradyrhizobium sp. F1.13.1]
MPMNSAPLPRIEAETMRRITWRLLPFFMVCYFISYVDRVNAGFAALQMNKDLGLTQTAFGAGGALFYIAYIIFEVPSNLAMQKVGARIWIARIMITWGMVGILSAFAVGPVTFYLSRFLLGAAEAGFFPGVILYLTFWFSGGLSRTDRCGFHGGHTAIELSGIADIRRLAGDGWLAGSAWLAVAFHR